MTMEILLEPTSNKLSVASAAAKPCQGDSSEFYLITGSIYTDQQGTVVIATVFNEVTKTLSDSKVTPTKHRRITKPYLSPRFNANCFNAGYLKMEVKIPDSSCLKDS
ncbi:hypothetical protein Tco_0813927 [Tanacetum coccineum]